MSLTLTPALLAAHVAQGHAIDAAVEALALGILKATGKMSEVTPYYGETARHNDYWSFRGWELNADSITVSYEFTSQSPDHWGFDIPLSYLPKA